MNTGLWNMDSGLAAAPRPGMTAKLMRYEFVHAAKAALTWLTTLAQSPREGWRNSRIVGYHGLSLRSSSQRQSAAACSMSQTGTPSAPARCATIVSTVMTRSRAAIVAAVSATESEVNSAAIGGPSRVTRQLSYAGPRCKLTNATPGTAASGARAPNVSERSGFQSPAAQHKPTLRPANRASRQRAAAMSAGFARRYGTAAGIVSSVVRNA